MASFVWKPEYNTNIKVIDDQHKKLVETINMLGSVAGENKDVAVLAKVFVSLLEYTTAHFGTEENFMIIHSYPGYMVHKQAHDKCAKKVSDLKRRFDKGDVEVVNELSIFMIDWLHHHIPEMDMKYVPFFHEKGLE